MVICPQYASINYTGINERHHPVICGHLEAAPRSPAIQTPRWAILEFRRDLRWVLLHRSIPVVPAASSSPSTIFLLKAKMSEDPRLQLWLETDLFVRDRFAKSEANTIDDCLVQRNSSLFGSENMEKRALELYLHTLPLNPIIFVSSVFRKMYSKRNLISGLGFFFNYPISEGQVNMSHVIVEYIWLLVMWFLSGLTDSLPFQRSQRPQDQRRVWFQQLLPTNTHCFTF